MIATSSFSFILTLHFLLPKWAPDAHHQTTAEHLHGRRAQVEELCFEDLRGKRRGNQSGGGAKERPEPRVRLGVYVCICILYIYIICPHIL